MYSPNKHSYLQARIPDINPRIINRSVNLARSKPTIDSIDFEPSWNRLTSEQPCIPIENIDVTRRPLAFGRWALPKLRTELHDPDLEVVLQALTSISDLVHDPEKGYEAINLRIPDRIADLLVHEDAAIRERCCMVLTILAGLADGKNAIVKNKQCITNMVLLVDDEEDAVKIKNAALLLAIATSWMCADDLVEGGFISLLLSTIRRDVEAIIVLHLETLNLLMYGEGKDEALQLGAFEVFIHLLETGSEDVQSRAAYCLMTVTSSYIGKEVAYSAQILPRLTSLLHRRERQVYTSAAAAIMFCTVQSKAKLEAGKIKHLPERLVELTRLWHYPETQLFSIQALTNICEHPDIRQKVGELYLGELEKIIVGNNIDVKRHKEILLSVINAKPWTHYF